MFWNFEYGVVIKTSSTFLQPRPQVKEWVGATSNPLVGQPQRGRGICVLKNSAGHRFQDSSDWIHLHELRTSPGRLHKNSVRDPGRRPERWFDPRSCGVALHSRQTFLNYTHILY